MKDLPIFPCQDGMASLILSEIPYKREAYILVRSVFGSLDGLLRECAAFCRSAGAERIYAGGEQDFSAYPVYAHIVERSLDKALLPETEAEAVLTTDPEWTELYNRSFHHVHGAKTYRSTPENAYFILEKGQRIGLGQLIDNELAAVASLSPGCGEKSLIALAKELPVDKIRLLCAEENAPATRLYDRLGFSRDRVKRIWYEVG